MQYGMFYMHRREQSEGQSRTHSPAHQSAHTDACKTYHIAYTTASVRTNARVSKHLGDISNYVNLFVFFCGRPWQAAGVLQPAGLLYCPLWTFQLWPQDAPAPTDASRALAAEVGTYGRRIRIGQFCLNADFHVTFRDLLHAANLRHGNHGFTSLPKESVLRIFRPLKIRRLRPSLNPRTWVPEANTLTPRPPKPLYILT
jgi:hypothetical protein